MATEYASLWNNACQQVYKLKQLKTLMAKAGQDFPIKCPTLRQVTTAARPLQLLIKKNERKISSCCCISQHFAFAVQVIYLLLQTVELQVNSRVLDMWCHDFCLGQLCLLLSSQIVIPNICY